MKRLGGIAGPGVDCGCCVCEECCNGQDPTEFDVTITLVDDDCTICDSVLSGTYTLSRATGGTYAPCRWEYDAILGEYCDAAACSGANCNTVIGMAIQLTINCLDATTYQIGLVVDISTRVYTSDPNACSGYLSLSADITNRYVWNGTATRTSGECLDILAKSLDFYSASCDCTILGPATKPCGDLWEFWVCNNTPGAATISAVP